MPGTFTPIYRRPAFWTFISSSVAFWSLYFVEGTVDSGLLLDVISALLILVGIGSGTFLVAGSLRRRS